MRVMEFLKAAGWRGIGAMGFLEAAGRYGQLMGPVLKELEARERGATVPETAGRGKRLWGRSGS